MVTRKSYASGGSYPVPNSECDYIAGISG